MLAIKMNNLHLSFGIKLGTVFHYDVLGDGNVLAFERVFHLYPFLNIFHVFTHLDFHFASCNNGSG